MTPKHHPALFNGEMVRGILSGAKTQTRREVKLLREQPTNEHVLDWCHYVGGLSWNLGNGCDCKLAARNPFGNVGDNLWVRETCRAEELESGLDGVRYAADGAFREIENTPEAADRWCDLYHYRGGKGLQVPSIHMPRWASRITLEITDVRVERLQGISEEDAIAEGCERRFEPDGSDYGCGLITAVESFAKLWQSIYGNWDANPWVWVISFKKID